ncbi:UNVERIFIED_CONTAM: protein LATERAL ORGAN BOUNDARIES [Sesamum calycinum]|uniref:Protein LATERAL ORGAN BOUNDARIES n=1 Tax=Sesamum calycinum TaxID=2727403 RepID=A0AAW2NER2_9LAMI
MHTGLHFCTLFPPGRASEIRQRSQDLRGKQRDQTSQRASAHQREDAVNSLAYEAEARVRDPVYGCISAISFLQRQVERLQKELDAANADLIRFTCNDIQAAELQPPRPPPKHWLPHTWCRRSRGRWVVGEVDFIKHLASQLSHIHHLCHGMIVITLMEEGGWKHLRVNFFKRVS